MLKDYVRGKLLFVHAPPALTPQQRDAFYGRATKNVLDHDKLQRLANGDGQEDVEEEVEEEVAEEELEEQLKEQEEFLHLWRHPMHEFGATGSSVNVKGKKEKRARVLRRIEKRNQKSNRALRRDSDNFVHGSNAVIISAVPRIKPKNSPVLL